MANNEYMVQRSGASCIREAYLLFINNIKRIFLNTWKPVLAFSLVAGLGTLLLPPVFNTAMVDAPQTELQAIANYASTVFGPVIYQIVCCGVFFWILANVQTLLTGGRQKENIKHSLKFYLASALFYVVIFLLLNIIGYLVGISLVKGGMSVNRLMYWLLIGWGFIGLVFLLHIPAYYYATVKCLQRVDLNPFKSFLPSLWGGIRHWGFLFKVFFITGIITLLINCVVFLPTAVILMAQNVDAYNQIVMGDPSGLPSTFPLWMCLSIALSAFILSYVGIWQYLYFFIATCSLDVRDQKKKEAQALAAQPQETTEKKLDYEEFH